MNDIIEQMAYFLFQLGYPYDMQVYDSDHAPVWPPIEVLDALILKWAEFDCKKDLTPEDIEDYQCSFAVEIGDDPWWHRIRDEEYRQQQEAERDWQENGPFAPEM